MSEPWIISGFLLQDFNFRAPDDELKHTHTHSRPTSVRSSGEDFSTVWFGLGELGNKNRREVKIRESKVFFFFCHWKENLQKPENQDLY